MDKKYKVLLPNILTSLRIFLTPVIIILGLTKNYLLMIILVVICALSDFFDGFLARKWHTTSKSGAKLDALSDKVFAIGILLGLLNSYSLIKYLVILEVIIGIINLYFHYKTNRTESLYIGKFKTTFLFITIILYLVNLITDINIILNAFTYVTINLQILSLISYIINYFNKKKPSIDDNKMHNSIMNTVDLEDTIVLNKITDLDEENDNF